MRRVANCSEGWAGRDGSECRLPEGRDCLFGNCHESNPGTTAVGGIFGYSHTAGGHEGGQAEYVRVPYADVGPTTIPDWMDEDDASS